MKSGAARATCLHSICSIEMASVGPTLEVDAEYSEEVDGGEREEEEEKAWGRLFPVGKGFTALDLVDDDYTFGRAEMCDYCFEEHGGKSNPKYLTFSSTHFHIYKEADKSDSSKYLVFIEDKSSNGTFVNKEKIGKNKTRILNSDDEIALSVRNNKAFVFNDKGVSDNHTKLLPPEFTEKYTLSKFLGRGACGEVKLAFEKATCQRFAVKIISKKTFSVGPQLGRAAMDEVKILKALEHPCVIHIEDLYETPTALYIVLELVEGGELFDRVVNGKFSERIAKLLFYQMLVAVTYLHDKGITHRDLKPENVLLSSDNEETLIKVTDFGLSKFVGENSLMKTLCGTPSYLAPEVIKSAGLGGYSKAVDCWSLGVILYIMLCGYPPFSNDFKEYSLDNQICNARYQFHQAYWKDISDEAKDLVKKFLTVNAKKRITTSAALKHPWMQDDEVIECATKLMKEGAEKHNMPSPVFPNKRPLDGDGGDEPGSKRRPTAADTPSPTTTGSPSVYGDAENCSSTKTTLVDSSSNEQ